MSEQLPLGKVITDPKYHDDYRDAVHVAVIPAVAGEHLDPGMRVGPGRDGMYVECVNGVDLVGLVDPFLPNAVKRSERFWLFLYPGTVTSLRHHWQHPAFTATTAGDEPGSPVKLPERFIDRIHNLPERSELPDYQSDRDGWIAAITEQAKAEESHQRQVADDEATRAAPFAAAVVRSVEPGWRTEAVVGLARGVRETKSASRLPVLADALDDAGCSDAAILTACRAATTTDNEAVVLACKVLGGEYTDAVIELESIADRLDLTVNGLMEAAERWEQTHDGEWGGEYTTQMGSEHWRDNFDSRVAARFWTAWRTVTGQTPKDGTAQFFSCSC